MAFDASELRFVRNGSVRLAYEVRGSGPIDIVVVPAWASNLDVYREDWRSERFNRRLAAFARVISFDKRGTGLSTRTVAAPTLEDQVDDVRAVMDAAGSERAALLGFWEGGAMSALFAAGDPHRVSALVLYGMTPAFVFSADAPWAPPRSEVDRIIDAIPHVWGTAASIDRLAPSLAGDAAFRSWWARLERGALDPDAAAERFRINSTINVEAILPSIRVPTLVLHRTDDAMVPLACGRHIAKRIPGAQFVELPGIDHLPFVGDVESVLGAIQEFLTGVHPVLDIDREVLTVLFTDITQSTKLASELGDHDWRALLEAHRAVVRPLIEQFRGHEIDTAGDGFLATFDGPARAIKCAIAIRAANRHLGLDIRSGLHTGEVERIGTDIAGIAVHIGARVAALSGPGEILVTSTVRDLVAGSNLSFSSRGPHTLKGVPEPWAIYAVKDHPG